ncbi:MAG TPA: hypothetical protein VM434_18595 [Beijerinckiaceae bacterium]|nr:hypothetical protein [Beijerinckiaceae bacterium]
MRKIAFALAGALAFGVAAVPASAGGFGWGSQYNAHLDPYDGRPLGPPLTAFGPVYDQGDPRGYYAPRYQYYNGRLIVVAPDAAPRPPARAYR